MAKTTLKAVVKSASAQSNGAEIINGTRKIEVNFLEDGKAPMDEKIEVQGFALTREQLLGILNEFECVYNAACNNALISKGTAVAQYKGLNYFLTYSKDEKTDRCALEMDNISIAGESELQKGLENGGCKVEKIPLPFGSVLC
jgi:hypothetical protein